MIHSLINSVRHFLGGDGALILPEMELLLFALGILLIDRWLAAREKYWNAALALGGTVFSGFTLYLLLRKIQVLKDRNPDAPGLLGFHENVLADPFFLYFAALFLVATALIVLLSVHYLQIEEEGRGTYYALLLSACAGMMLMASGINLIVILMGLLTMELSCIFLMGILRRDQRSREARRKYFFRSVIGFAILAAGLPLFYRMFGTINIGRIGAILDLKIEHDVPFAGLTAWPAIIALGLLAAGMFFKIEAAPFHLGIPGIYEAAPTPVSAYLSVAAKTASVVLLLRLYIFIFLYAQEKWLYVIACVSIASLTWGNLAALRQTSLKRLLAYSSISHTGFLLLGLVAGNDSGFYAIAFYLFVYTFMTAGAFGMVILLHQRGSAGANQNDVDGLYGRSPATALLLLVFSASLAGIPPTAGFSARYAIFKALLETKHPYLAGFAVLSIVPGLYYYLRIVLHAWKQPRADAPRLTLTGAQAVALTVAVFVSLVAGLYSEPFKRLAHYAFGP